MPFPEKPSCPAPGEAPREPCASTAAQKVWRGKKPSCWCGVFPPGHCVVGLELALVPESTLWGRKGPTGDYPAMFQMLLGGHREKQGFSQVIQHIASAENQIFHGRSTDLASTSQFTCCLLPCRSPAETSATSCNESTHLGISAICFCLLSLSSLLLLYQCAKMLHIQKGNHCWIQAAQPSAPALCRVITRRKWKACL